MTSTRFPELQVLSLNELDLVHGWSRARSNPDDPFEGWTAPWRTESLQHYLKLGWSMFKRNPDTGELLGYVLAQPILFMRTQTQSVWIEYVDALTPAIKTELVDTIIRVSREKHMQRVLFEARLLPMDQGLGEIIRGRGGRVIEEDMIEIATTKG